MVRKFIEKNFEDWMKENGIDHRLISPYQPQSNGMVKSFNGTIQKILLKLPGGDEKNGVDIYQKHCLCIR